jgi:hypothetical protein
MADIIELIAQQGKGAHDYPLRMSQMAQAERTRQATETDRQQSTQQGEIRQLKIDKQRDEFGRQQELNEIGQTSASTEEWLEKLKTSRFQPEYLQFKEMQGQIDVQTQKIDESKREGAQEEAAFLSHVLKDVTDLEGLQRSMEIYDKRYPDSDVDEMVDRENFNLADIAKYRFSSLAAVDSFKLRKEQRLQESADIRAEQAQRRLEQGKRRLDLGEEAAGKKSYRAQRKSTGELRKEYTKETAVVSGALNQIKLAREALSTGSPLSTKMAQAVISKVANSKVRALAELEQYKNFGNLQQRIAGFFSKTLLGTYSNEQQKMALEALDDIESMYNEMKGDSKHYFRYLANKDKLDSHAVAKYDSPDEIMANPYLKDKEKIDLAEEVFPNYDWGK